MRGMLTCKRRNSPRCWGWLALILSMTISVRLSAQVAGATLSGTVVDKSGAIVANAHIVIKNLATGVTRDVTSDAAGFYTAPNLLPGGYQVTTSATGFATLVRTGITLTVGAQQVLNLTLQVGTVSQQIEVVGEAPTVELASSSITAEVNSVTVRELPLNGRSWTDLATLQPGVNAIQTQVNFTAGADRGNRGFGSQMTISGARPQQNSYRLDGVNINDYSNGAPGSVLGGNLGVDAIQEFSVLTSNYSAEYGRTAGGVVNAITKSGTNGLHGSVYEFLRNNAFDARNFFDGPTIPPFRRNQFGASAGGPIRKDRTFIFGDYEAIRQSKGIAFTDTVPSPAARMGILAGGTPLTGSCPPEAHAATSTNLAPGQATICVDDSAAKYLPLIPKPNGSLLGAGDLGVFSFPAQQVVSENFFTTRVDHKISGKDGLFGTYLYDDTVYQSPDAFDVQTVGSHTKRQIVALEENHVFSSNLINTARAGYSREAVSDNSTVSVINPLAADTSLGPFPGGSAAQLLIQGVTPFSGGTNGSSRYLYNWNSFQGYDDVFVTHGTHSLKFGVSVERIQLNMRNFSNPTGVYRFASLAGFLTNQPSRFNGPSGLPRDFRQTVFGTYAQDDWHLRPNLTLNLGLRYEMATVPKEALGKFSNLLDIADTTPQLGNPLFLNPTLGNFEPRVGFAWDPFGNGKTAVRGGFGIFDVLALPNQLTLATNSQPFSVSGSTHNTAELAGTFFAGAPALITATTLQQTIIQHAPKRSYVMQWNLNAQRELLPNLTAMVGYVGSRGVHQPIQDDDMNNVIPTLTSAGYLFPQVDVNGNLCIAGTQCASTTGNPPSKINPNFGAIRGIFYQGNSFYDALEVGIVKKMSRNFRVQGSFTWGKSIDTSSATVGGDQFSNSISSLWPRTDPNANRALSDFNVGRTLVINAMWDIPGLKSSLGPVNWATNGWELGAIYTVSDGVPFSPTFGTDSDPLGLSSSDPWDFASRLTGPGCATAVNPGNPNNYIKTQCFTVPIAPSMAFWQANCDPAPPTLGGPLPTGSLECFNLRGNAGRNSLIGPGTSELDFSIFKNNPIKKISESFNVQFRAEFFNILNHPNFAVPSTPGNTDIFDSTGTLSAVAGLLTATTTTAREIQFALKVIW
jgi:hypothetical protein